MKKLIQMILFIFCSVALNAEEVFDFPDTEKGQYIYYLDNRGETPRLTGFFKYFDNTIVCRTINLKTKQTLVVTLKILRNKDEFQIIPIDVIDGNDENMLPFLIADIANMASQFQINSKNLAYENKSFKDDWPEFGYTLEHTYTKNIPFFHLITTRNLNFKNKLYEAIFTGRMREQKDLTFLEINSPQVTENKMASFKIPTSLSKPAKFRDVNIVIDENWKFIGAGTISEMPYDSYWLSIKSKRDAQMGVEVLELDKMDKQFLNISAFDLSRMLVRNQEKVIPASIKITLRNSNEVITEFTAIDKKTNWATFMVYRTILKNKIATIFSFSAYLETYKSNQKYFEKILLSVDLK